MFLSGEGTKSTSKGVDVITLIVYPPNHVKVLPTERKQNDWEEDTFLC